MPCSWQPLCRPHRPHCSILLAAPCQTLGWLPPNFFSAWTNFLQSSGWREASLIPKALPYGPPSAKCTQSPLFYPCRRTVIHKPSGAWRPLQCFDLLPSSHPCSFLLVSFLWVEFSDMEGDGEGSRSVEMLQKKPEASLLVDTNVRKPGASPGTAGVRSGVMGQHVIQNSSIPTCCHSDSWGEQGTITKLQSSG